MRSRILMAGVVLAFVIGCAKKSVKNPEPSKDETAAVKAETPTKPEPNSVKKEDGPNWLTDPRFKKDQGDVPFEAKGPSKPPGNVTPPKEGWNNPNVVVQPVPANPGAMPPANPGVVPPANPGAMPPANPGAGPANPGNGNPMPVPIPGQPVPPGMGVLQPQPAPVPPKPANPMVVPSAPKFSPVSEQDMKDVWIFIENSSLASGKMPSPALTYQALVAAKSPAAELVKNGSIILTGSAQRESVWAFEAKAVLQGGLIANQNSVETVTAQQLKPMLGTR